MGMYTLLHLNVNLRDDTPNEVINVIKYMIGENVSVFAIADSDMTHSLFQTERWETCLHNIDGGFSCAHVSELNIKPWMKQLSTHASCKNYDDEYEKFLDYIWKYIELDSEIDLHFIGYIWYEEQITPDLLYITHHGIERLHIEDVECLYEGDEI